jgi:FixJ family two-component response regulator
MGSRPATRDMSINEYFKSETILVAIVDDDESVRESLPDLLKEFGVDSKAFATPMEYLESDYVGMTKCLISDVAMPGMSGPELRGELARRGHAIPTILITAHEDAAGQAEVVEGAIACLIKPFNETALLVALKKALNSK